MWSILRIVCLSFCLSSILLIYFDFGKVAKYEIQNPQLVTQHEQICCVTSGEFDEKQPPKPKFVAQSKPVFYFSRQLSLACNRYCCCVTNWLCKVKNTKHQPKICNEAMLRDKLRVIVSGIFPPLLTVYTLKWVLWIAQKQSFQLSAILGGWSSCFF